MRIILTLTLALIASSASAQTLYVIDSGVNLPVAQRVDFTGGDGYDYHGHGTAMASIAGVPAQSIVSVRVLDGNNNGNYWQIRDGLAWVRSQAVAGDVVLFAVNNYVIPQHDYAWDAEIEASIQNGVTWVVSAGNGNDWAFWTPPARVTTAIVVAAADGLDRASYSNFGPTVDVFADACLQGWCGTSVSAAKVAGDVFNILAVDWWAPPAHVTNILTGSCAATMVTPGPGTTHCKR